MGGESRSVLWRNWRSAGGRARRRVFGLIGACLGICLAPAGLLSSVAMGQTTLTWGPGGTGGSGTWSTANSWWNGSTNGNWSSGANAVFGGTAGQVFLGGNQTAGDVQFNTPGYTLAFNLQSFEVRTLTLTSLSGSALSSTTFSPGAGGTVNLVVNGEVSFNGTVGNLSKRGTGRLTLAAGATMAGSSVDITAGTLRWATASSLPNAVGFGDTNSVLELAAGDVSRVFATVSYTNNRFRLNNASNNYGFAAIGDDRTVTMANSGDVTWGVSGENNMLVSSLILGTADATHKLTLTHQAAGSGTGLRLAGADGTFSRTIRVDDGAAGVDAEIAMALKDGTTAARIGGIEKTGSGVLKLSAVNTYTGATSVSQGVLLIDGSTAASSAVSVASGAAIGGNGTINGNLTLLSGARFAFDTTSTLDLGGSFSLTQSFGVDDLVSTSGSAVDWANIAQDTYTLMNTSFSFNTGNISNFGADEAADLGGGKSAYFQQGSGSLELVVVPEPATMALAAVGVATLAWTYLRRKAV